jgi:hypothetical protein
MPFDYAVHPNLLVYWTGGRNIDKLYDPQWHMRNSSSKDYDLVKKEVEELRKANQETYGKLEVPAKDKLEQLEDEYLMRLRSILKHGLWMNTPSDTDKEPDSETTLCVNKRPSRNISLPEDTARVCFTELRLSQARAHAERYGRLGIGVKPPFVLDRGGRPVIYLGPKTNRERDAFFRACDRLFHDSPQRQALFGACERLFKGDQERNAFLSTWQEIFKDTDPHLLHFLKPMHSSRGAPADFYAESEWRIVYTDLLDPTSRKAGFPGESHQGRCSHCVKAVDPRTDPPAGFSEYMDALRARFGRENVREPDYLLPLDGWLSCIIYPSVSLKRQALEDEEIRGEMKRIKTDPDCRANDIEVEKGNWPVEMDLDLCRNF